jgi:glycerate-2-kinase
MRRTREAGVDVYEELSKHNSYQALTELGDTITTGAQGTNVQDLRLVYIGK